MDCKLMVLLALVAAATARPMEQLTPVEMEDNASVNTPVFEIEREKREQASEDRQDYGPPVYKPEPYKPEPAYKPEPYKPHSYKPHLPAQIKTFAKTDYHANFKWGVKHNIQEPGSGYH